MSNIKLNMVYKNTGKSRRIGVIKKNDINNNSNNIKIIYIDRVLYEQKGQNGNYYFVKYKNDYHYLKVSKDNKLLFIIV